MVVVLVVIMSIIFLLVGDKDANKIVSLLIGVVVGVVAHFALLLSLVFCGSQALVTTYAIGLSDIKTKNEYEYSRFSKEIDKYMNNKQYIDYDLAVLSFKDRKDSCMSLFINPFDDAKYRKIEFKQNTSDFAYTGKITKCIIDNVQCVKFGDYYLEVSDSIANLDENSNYESLIIYDNQSIEGTTQKYIKEYKVASLTKI